MSEEISRSNKVGNLPFFEQVVFPHRFVLKIKNSSSAGVQLHNVDLYGAAVTHCKQASVHDPLLLQTT